MVSWWVASAFLQEATPSVSVVLLTTATFQLFFFFYFNTYYKQIGWQLPKHIDITRQRQQKNYLSVVKPNLSEFRLDMCMCTFNSTAWTQSFDSLEMGHFILYF